MVNDGVADVEDTMSEKYADYRYLLTDRIRQEINFMNTEQSRGLPAPALQKEVPGNADTIQLPSGKAALDELGSCEISKAIAGRESVRDYADEPLNKTELSALLWGTQGVRQVLSPACALRTVPSAGARHAFETYLAIQNVTDMVPGIYRYLPFDEELILIDEDDHIGVKAARACLGQRFVASAAVTFFWTVIPARMEWRYDLAAHKVIAIDVGHVCQNLYLMCESLNAGTCAIAAYDQEKCDELLGVDGKEEFTLYISPVGKR